MMTDRFFVYPTEKAMKDHCRTLKGHSTFCYRYLLDYCGRKSFLDILHQETQQHGAASAFGEVNETYYHHVQETYNDRLNDVERLILIWAPPFQLMCSIGR